jgi:hypothetical protein
LSDHVVNDPHVILESSTRVRFVYAFPDRKFVRNDSLSSIQLVNRQHLSPEQLGLINYEPEIKTEVTM